MLSHINYYYYKPEVYNNYYGKFISNTVKIYNNIPNDFNTIEHFLII